MTRKRFFSIRSHLKVVVDRDVSEEIRKKYELWKIKPLADQIKLLFVVRATAHSLKNFVCATSEGSILDFENNQGKGTLLENCDVNLGLKTAAVIRLTRSLKPGTQNKVRNDGKVDVIQWFDQKPILLASTALGQHPTDNCERWSKKDSKYMLVSRPCIVKCYNDYSMGGIDSITE
ncbi:hypothetical protein JTB14_008634 [Gonioctena quinquepunctata]|nr:hypothetical protein JTB14_008634 [Gonioctena quinquepunctata]